LSDIAVTLLGTGRVGRDVARLLADRQGVRVVSAWSRNPAHAGSDVGSLAGAGPIGVEITSDRDAALARSADVAVIATTSFLEDVAPDIEAAVTTGHNVLCTAEEAAFPWSIDGQVAARLDALARERDVTIVGSGANPGFIFDALVTTLALAAPDVERIRISRVVDLSRFSETVLRRLGLGFSPEEFAAGRDAGRIHGHIGFPQSMHLVASAFGRSVERVDGAVDALIAERPFSGEHLEVSVGRSAGFVQSYTGVVGGHDWFHAQMTGHLDPPAIGLTIEDTIAIDGTVPLSLVANPGFRAQETSAAVLANSVTRVAWAPAGWLTVAELPPAGETASRRSPS
jgi:4-hydroxy-tetrahydrodipicolinate reductase